MNAAYFDDTDVAEACGVTTSENQGTIPAGKHVDVAEFRRLMVSHRKLVRVDLPGAGLKGLRDRETGETYYTDAHRLMAK